MGDPVNVHYSISLSQGIRTKDGVHHKFDVIIYATGFRIEESICGFKVSGRKDTSLREHFDRHPCAHLGISVPSFPNYFILLGPNTVLAHNSVLFMIEWQANYITDAILKMARSVMRRAVAQALTRLPWQLRSMGSSTGSTRLTS